MIPNISVHVDLNRSCNWRCCWGCRHVEESDAEQFERMKRELDKAYEAAKKVIPPTDTPTVSIKAIQ